MYVPRLGAPIAAGYVRLHELARTLRERCPWDIEQTHASLVPYLVEETFELVDAIAALDPDDPATEEALIEELGDVLYQVEFHATIAEQAGRFSMADVTDDACTTSSCAATRTSSATSRPHDADAVKANWDDIKRDEKARTSVFDGVPTSLPALAYGQHLARKAAKVGFDWPDVDGPLAKVDEELAELRAARRQRRSGAHRRRAGRRGDRGRQRRPSRRRRRRAGGAGRRRRSSAAASRPSSSWPPSAASTCGRRRLDELDALWDEVKSRERRPQHPVSAESIEAD